MVGSSNVMFLFSDSPSADLIDQWTGFILPTSFLSPEFGEEEKMIEFLADRSQVWDRTYNKQQGWR